MFVQRRSNGEIFHIVLAGVGSRSVPPRPQTSSTEFAYALVQKVRRIASGVQTGASMSWTSGVTRCAALFGSNYVENINVSSHGKYTTK